MLYCIEKSILVAIKKTHQKTLKNLTNNTFADILSIREEVVDGKRYPRYHTTTNKNKKDCICTDIYSHKHILSLSSSHTN